jgi:hypothetical protein
MGNLIKKSGSTMNYGSNGSGPHAVTNAVMPDGSVMPMEYDAAGNMTKRGEADLLYDQNHRLRKITQSDNKLKTVSYELKEGFNLISFPILPVESMGFDEEGVPVTGEVKERDILEVLSSTGITFGSEIKQISRFNPQTQSWEHFVNDPDYNQFTTFEVGRSYEIYCDAPVSFTLTGLSPQSEVTRSLYPGKNFVGFTITEEVPASEIGNHYTLEGTVEDILRFDSATQQFQSLNAGEFSRCKPGEGYVVLTPSPEGEAISEPSVTRFSLPVVSHVSEFTYDSSGSRVKKQSGDSLSFFLGFRR